MAIGMMNTLSYYCSDCMTKPTRFGDEPKNSPMDKYFYLDANNQQAGPAFPQEFARLGVGRQTMVWKQGMSSWVPAGQLPELQSYFESATPPPPPHSESATLGNVSSSASTNSSATTGNAAPARPENNLLWAILTTCLCCLPLGIYAIVQASKVNTLYAEGNYAEAKAMADDAKKWSIIGAVVGLAVNIFFFFLVLVGQMM